MENAATVDAPGPIVTSQSEVAPAGEPAEKPEQHDESAPSQSDATDEPQKPKGQGGFQKRIEALTRQKYEQQQENDQLRHRLEEIERKQSQPAADKQPADSGDAPPDEAKFTDYIEYLRANARYEARQEARAIAKADREQAEQQRAQSSVQERVQQRQMRVALDVEKYSEAVPDFRQVAGSAITSPDVIHALLESDHGAAVTYYLGLNPDEADRIVQASRGNPVRAAIEIARLESTAQATLQSRTRSNASRQGQPLSTGGAVRDDTPTTKDSMADFAKKWYAARRKG